MIADHLSRLLFLGEGGEQNIAAKSIKGVLEDTHAKLSHPGMSTMYNTLRRYVKAKGLKREIEQLV